MKAMKTNVYKYRTLPPVLFLFVMFSLLFAACIAPFNQQTENEPHNIPPGRGAFSLVIGEVNMRTIMPVGGTDLFAVYELEFYESNTLSETAERTNGNLADPVYLNPGTYELRVTAYTDAGKTKPAAEGTADIEIISDESVSCTINLEAIVDEGTGTFTWNITLPSGLQTASMTISPLNNTGPVEINLLTTGAGSRVLNTGYYRLTFSLSKEGKQSIMPREYLHIYQNLESNYTFAFTDAHLNTSHYTVTLQLHNGDDDFELDYWYGDTIIRPADPTWVAHNFIDWYADAELTTLYTFGAQVYSDFTLYAKWELANSPDNPFLVTSEEQLRYVGKGTANPVGYKEWTLSAHYQQTENIPLTTPWTRIGDDANPFTGTYNGNGRTITGLSISAALGNQGMFGYIGAGGKVEKLGLINVDINSNRGPIGGIAGGNEGVIQSCYVTGSVTGTAGIVDVGGIAGVNYGGTIQNCYVNGIINGTEAVGGIAGVNYSVIQNCYVSGSVSSGYLPGGIAGNNRGTIQNCVALNESVTLTTGATIGRISGTSSGTLQNNYAWKYMSTGTTIYNPTLSDINGADVTATDARTEAWWTTAGNWNNSSLWNFTEVWQWNTNGMPSPIGVGTVQLWPDYL